MHDELTAQDIQQMREELHYRRAELMPEQLEAVKTARAFGDLSENFEYKAAKMELNKNKSRIRYLQRMIDSAVIISDESKANEIGLYDKVTVRMEGIDKEMTYQIVTTMRADALKGLITRESPVGQALFGHSEGETVHVQVNAGFGYDMEIVKVEKGEDDGSIRISRY